MTTKKIATCCYCGTRAALILRGRERHELSCASCGAPLHDLKMLRTDQPGKRELVKPSPVRNERYPHSKRRKPKPRRSLKRRLFEEAWDLVEDIFD
jgi:hypothetical protein